MKDIVVATVITITCLLLVGYALSTQAVTPKDQEAQELVDSLAFVRHKNGQCFSVTPDRGYSRSTVTPVDSKLCD